MQTHTTGITYEWLFMKIYTSRIREVSGSNLQLDMINFTYKGVFIFYNKSFNFLDI